MTTKTKFGRSLSEGKLLAQSRSCRETLNTVLCASFAAKRPADRTISSIFRANRHYGSRDRQIISEGVFGVFRWWGILRKLMPSRLLQDIEKVLLSLPDDGKDSFLKMPDQILNMLLLGAFILEKREIPELCVIWAGELGIDLKGFMNSIRNKPQLADEKFYSCTLDFLNKNKTASADITMKDLLPEWIWDRMPEKTMAGELVKWFQIRPPIWIRAQTVNPDDLIKKLSAEGITAQRHPKIENAMKIENAKVNLYTLESFKKGMFEIQDLASQSIGLVCAPKPGERWWDTCAGAGGKSLQISDMMKGKGSVLATDIREYKLEDLRKRARRAGYSNIICNSWDGKGLRRKKQGKFDGVLVDAPCTCSGTWRRNPDARWNLAPEEIKDFAEMQLKILRNAASGVKAGGTLVYATCSFFPEENSAVAKSFLEGNSNFEFDTFLNPLTGKDCEGMISIYPHEGNCDAMFAARFRRKES